MMRYGLLLESSRARPDLAIPELDGPPQSLVLVHDLLTQHPGWGPDRLCTLTTADLEQTPTIHDLERRIERFVSDIKLNDFLFVYYIGHAHRRAEGGMESLDLALPKFDLPARVLITTCYMAPINRVFLVFDCCFAERVAASAREHTLGRALTQWVNNLFEPHEREAVGERTRVIFTACQTRERAFVSRDGAGVLAGSFTRAFVTGCCGGTTTTSAYNTQGDVTTLSLAEFLTRQMADEGLQRPVFDVHGAFDIKAIKAVDSLRPRRGDAQSPFKMLPAGRRLVVGSPLRFGADGERVVAADICEVGESAPVTVLAYPAHRGVDALGFTARAPFHPEQFDLQEHGSAPHALGHVRGARLFSDGRVVVLYASYPNERSGATEAAPGHSSIEVFALHQGRVRRIGSPIIEAVDHCLVANAPAVSAHAGAPTNESDPGDDDSADDLPARWLITADPTGSIRLRSVLKTTADHLLAVGLHGHEGRIRHVCVFVGARDPLLVTGGEDGRVGVWDLSQTPGQRAREPRELSPPHFLAPHGPLSAQVTRVAISASGAFIAAGYADGHVCLWRGVDGASLLRVKAHATLVTALEFSPAEHWLASGDGRGEICVRAVAASDVEHRFTLSQVCGQDVELASLDFSPDDRLLLASANGPSSGVVAVVSDLESSGQVTLISPIAPVNHIVRATCGAWSGHTYRVMIVNERGVESRLLWWEEADRP
jgi:hypothetical protein